MKNQFDSLVTNGCSGFTPCDSSQLCWGLGLVAPLQSTTGLQGYSPTPGRAAESEMGKAGNVPGQLSALEGACCISHHQKIVEKKCYRMLQWLFKHRLGCEAFSGQESPLP